MSDKTQEQKDYKRLLFETRERQKELAAINKTTSIIKEGIPPDETFQKIVLILPRAWQYPDYTTARISYGGKEYKSQFFRESKWRQSAAFETIDGNRGSIEIFYTEEFEEIDEGPFLMEERHLIENLASIITGYLNSLKAKEIYLKGKPQDPAPKVPEEIKSSGITNRHLLQKFLNKSNYDRDIYHDLQPFKVKEILLVANLYDAYNIEKEGRFSEHVLGDYQALNLTSVPRITGVSSADEIFNQLENKYFDLIIFMMGVDKKMPISLSKKIKKVFPYIPIFILLNNNNDIAIFEDDPNAHESVDRVFVWNGDSKVFFSMIKLVEDKTNIENDTHVGLVRAILLIEDSPKYYSRYLPMLYNVVLEQTRRIIDDVTTDELYKVLRLRARPKIILASTYEEAMNIFETYKDFLLCVISDVEFRRDGEMLKDAGIQLLKQIRETKPDLPAILQSADQENAQKAFELKCTFIDKNSDRLMQDFQSFISHYLGFGNFVYRDKEGNQIGIATSLKDFEKQLKIIPDESLIYHGKRNHFSLWLMARGEIQAARIINPVKVTDFATADELREYLIDVVQKFRNEQNKGKVIPFEESEALDETNIVALTPGLLGGKGRGLAFINTLIYNFDFQQIVPGINIKTPVTSIIGADEFEYFIERNHLSDKIYDEENYDEIRKMFVEGALSESLVKKLRIILTGTSKPIAVRSSGLFEDSLTQPFAGIFETYLLPNNHPDMKVRLAQLTDAVKLVFASVFSPTARGYIRAINYKLEEERMAVVIQEVVGNSFGDVYYPHISGVAQSYNFYPFGHMKPDEGFAIIAVGLGKYVVEGEKTYRFSPLYPELEINSPKDTYKNSQLHFYAVNLKNNEPNLMEGEDAGLATLEISEGEKHGTLKHCASVYDLENDRISPGLDIPGPRVVNFANILKYGYIPLVNAIEAVLDIGKEALGTPVEIEFAIDLNKDAQGKASFYLLQIKPLIGNAQDYNIEVADLKQDEILLFTEKAMGNGLIADLHDVIYVKNEIFDKSKTEEMACEIENLNNLMIKRNKKYILIGPGRWGTRDRWIGIPVTWPMISNAKVIVETSLEDFPLDASSGSHFFHNVTSMNVGYFTVQQELNQQRIEWPVLAGRELVEETKWFRHVYFEKPLQVRMDGRKRISVITYEK